MLWLVYIELAKHRQIEYTQLFIGQNITAVFAGVGEQTRLAWFVRYYLLLIQNVSDKTGIIRRSRLTYFGQVASFSGKNSGHVYIPIIALQINKLDVSLRQYIE